MEPSARKDEEDSGGGRRCHLPPPPASWPAAGAVNRGHGHGEGHGHSKCPQGPAQQVASRLVLPLRSGFDEDFEVRLPGRGDTTFFVRVAGRELAATNGVAVVIHGGGFTGMSWAPAAGVMKRDCCVLAPDLRGHGLTASTDTDTEHGTAASNPDVGNGDDHHGHDQHAEGDSSDDGGSRDDGADALMSLESLAEDVTSLLVEIFARGLLSQQQQQPRQQQQQGQQQPPLQAETAPTPPIPDSVANSGGKTPASSRSTSSNEGRCPTSSSAATVGEDPPPRDVEETNEENGGGNSASCDASHATGARDSSSPAASSPEILPANPIKILLVGHSLGGSVAVRVAGAAEGLKRRCHGVAEVAGLVAVDVVEGTALASLDDMPEILRKIPRSFPSVEDAVLWHIKTGAVRNAASAHAVVPSRFKEDEEDEAGKKKVVWRTDLQATKRHWRGWFEGMSAAFLGLSVPKLLVVAGMDRLDTELTAAHMQGRFQLKLVYGCGHSVQEDQPDETAASIINFAIRNSIVRRGAGNGGERAGEEEELRLKLARARGQANRTRR